MKVQNQSKLSAGWDMGIEVSNTVPGAVMIKPLNPEGSVDLAKLGPVVRHVAPEELAEALNAIPGFTVTYEKPVQVPQGIGAVVQPRRNGLAVPMTITRISADNWRSNNSILWTDEDVANELRKGAKVLSEGVQL